MGYYDPSRDILYFESEMARDVLEIVDTIRHSIWVIDHKKQNPYTIRGTEIKLHKAKSEYEFFETQWSGKEEIPSMTIRDEKGSRISELHISGLMYGLRQNFFKKINVSDPKDPTVVIGWYLNPNEVFINCLPDVFEDFQTVYDDGGALALQGRGSPILGHLSSTFAKYVEREFRRSGGAYFKMLRLKMPTASASPSPP